MNGANVTLLFTRASTAAEYLSGKLKHMGFGASGESRRAHVHVMVGDAHDFYLHDPTNLAHYAGSVSVQPKVCLKFCESLEVLKFIET